MCDLTGLPKAIPVRGIVYDTLRDPVSEEGRIRSSGIAIMPSGEVVDVLSNGVLISVDFDAEIDGAVSELSGIDPSSHGVAATGVFRFSIGSGEIRTFSDNGDLGSVGIIRTSIITSTYTPGYISASESTVIVMRVRGDVQGKASLQMFGVSDDGSLELAGKPFVVASILCFAMNKENIYVARIDDDSRETRSVIAKYVVVDGVAEKSNVSAAVPGIVTDISFLDEVVAVSYVVTDTDGRTGMVGMFRSTDEKLEEVSKTVIPVYQPQNMTLRMNRDSLFVAAFNRYPREVERAFQGAILRYELSSLASLELSSRALLWGEPTKLGLIGDRLLVGMAGDSRLGFNRGMRGVSVFDISQRDRLIHLQDLHTPLPAEDFAVVGQQLFVATGGGGIYQYRVNDEAISYRIYAPIVSK